MPLEIPLPAFRQPRGLDEPLPTVPADSPPTSSDETSQPGPQRPTSDGDGQPEPPLPSLEPPAATRTRTSASRGETADPRATAKAMRGLLAIALGTMAALLARSGRHLRQPTVEQLGDVADPLGAILARHLPAEALVPDLVDATTAAAATHAYVLDGPLITSTPKATVIYPEEEQ